MSGLWAVHVGQVYNNTTMWPSHFPDLEALKEAWEDQSTDAEKAQFQTFLYHLEVLKPDWRERSTVDYSMIASKPAKFLFLIIVISHLRMHLSKIKLRKLACVN